MSNKVKYNKTGAEPNSLFKGNWAIDVSDNGLGGGPSSSTGLYNGAEVPAGGYLIYSPVEVYKALNGDELMAKIKDLGGDYSSVSAAITWTATQPDIFIVDKDVDNIVTDGLVLNLDAGNISTFNDIEPTTNLISQMIGGIAHPQIVYRSTAIEANVLDSNTPGGKYSRFTGIDGSSNNQLYTLFNSVGINVRNTTVTYSVYLRGSGTCHLTIYSDNKGYIVSPTITLNSDWTRYSITDNLTNYTNNAWVAVRGILNTTDVYMAAQQAEFKSYATPFVNGTRAQNTKLYDLSGIKKPLSELRVLVGRIATYSTPFEAFFTSNCNVTLAPTLNDIDLDVQYVKDNFDLVVADAYVWAIPSTLMSKLKDYVDAGVNCIATGNDNRTNVFVSGYNSSGRQNHSITMDSESRIGLNGQQFTYGSGDVFGGITNLQNGAKPIYYRDDYGFITGYVYDSLVSGASLYFDQEGLGINNEIFNAGVDYVTKNIINNKGILINEPAFDSTGAISFDGINDYIQISSRKQYLITEPWTIELVFKPTDDTASWNGLFGGYMNEGGYWMFHASGNLTYYEGSSVEAGTRITYLPWSKSNTFTKNISHHLTITYKPTSAISGTYTLYYNGGLKIHSFPWTFSFGYSLDMQFIGMGAGNRFGANDFYIFNLYNKSLTESEVLQNFNAQRTRFGI